MQAPTTSIPPLYRYNVSKLPLDIFVNLTTTTTTATLNDDAQKLQYDIVYKLKHVSGLRSVIAVPALDASSTTTNINASNYDYRITTVAKLLQLSPYGIFHRLDPILTLNECIRLYQRICIHCAPTYNTAYSLLSSSASTSSSDATSTEIKQPSSLPRDDSRYVSTGWDTLDRKLHGGLRVGTITELIGCAGTGKTQLALQTTITTALNHCIPNENDPGNRDCIYSGGGGTIWIDTEQKISLVRLQEMTIARCRSNHQSYSKDVYTVLENVTIHSPSNMNEFINVLDSLENEILDRNTVAATAAAGCCNGNTIGITSTSNQQQQQGKKLPVRLIVIDSIAAAVGRELTKTTTIQQQAIGMMQIAQLLKRYADRYSIAILIINQVTSTTSVHSFSSTNYPHQHQRAALGTAWHHCVTTRIELQQYDALNHDNQHQHHISTNHADNNTNCNDDSTISKKHKVPHRHAKIVKSLTVEPSYAPLPFQITIHGIADCVL
jgi:RecA/RadA recombinase